MPGELGRVVVVGGGIGGLCLAQGLQRLGIDVTVLERDEHAGSRWEGYRIHVDPAGSRSLHACLPDELWDAFLATAGPGGDFGFLTPRLEELVVVEESLGAGSTTDPAEGHHSVDRRTLRRLLLTGLDGVVRFGSEVRGYRRTATGVEVVLADGCREAADLVVGADGSRSRIARQYLPGAAPVPAGVGGLAQKLLLTDEAAAWVPERLQRGMNLVLDHRGPVALFTSAHHPPAGVGEALRRVGAAVPAGIDQPYLLCAIVTDSARLPDDVAALDGSGVRRLAGELLAGWHPTVHRMLDESEPSTRGGLLFTSSPRIEPWTPTRVTVLGDAVHTMPATGGLGGNTALRDARLLAHQLHLVDRGRKDLLAGVADYEAGLRDHGYAAIAETLGVRDQMLSSGRFAALALRGWFRACRYSGYLRRRTFADPPDAVSAPRRWERECAVPA